MSYFFTIPRLKEIYSNLTAEMVKGDVICEGDVAPVPSTQKDFMAILRIYLGDVVEAVRNTGLPRQELYNFLTQEVGLTDIEVNFFETKGFLVIPEKEVL